MDKWFERLTEHVSLANDDDAIKGALGKLSAEAGLVGFAYLNLRAETHTAVSNYHVKWQARYFNQSYALIDPVIHDARNAVAAFRWSSQAPRKLSKVIRNFYGEASEFGIRSGITIPVRTGFGRFSMLTLASEDIEFADRQTFCNVTAATAVAQLDSRLKLVNAKPTSHTPVRLKADELTCLRWSAEGKSMKAIAIIENTSYANVAFYMRNAKSALGATTLPQAIAIAKDLSLI